MKSKFCRVLAICMVVTVLILPIVTEYVLEYNMQGHVESLICGKTEDLPTVI